VEDVLFQGILFVAAFHKHFHGRTWINPDFSKRDAWVLGRWSKGVPAKKLEGIHLEDSEFERMFRVIGTDQVEARYVLSPGMMQRIKDIRTNWQSTIKVSFFDSKVAMALPTKYNFFEADLGEPLSGSAEFKRVCHELSLWTGLVEALPLWVG
jgi:hypothetical protein